MQRGLDRRKDIPPVCSKDVQVLRKTQSMGDAEKFKCLVTER